MKAKKGKDALNHCMSRVVGGDYIFGAKEKEQFVQMMWRLADFLGIQIFDYVVMSNHYHQLIFVPGVVELNDSQLLERLRAYHGEESLEVLDFEKALEKGGEWDHGRQSQS